MGRLTYSARPAPTGQLQRSSLRDPHTRTRKNSRVALDGPGESAWLVQGALGQREDLLDRAARLHDRAPRCSTPELPPRGRPRRVLACGDGVVDLTFAELMTGTQPSPLQRVERACSSAKPRAAAPVEHVTPAYVESRKARPTTGQPGPRGGCAPVLRLARTHCQRSLKAA